MRLTLIGTSILLMFGAVGAIENNEPLLVPALIIGAAVVMGFTGALMKDKP